MYMLLVVQMVIMDLFVLEEWFVVLGWFGFCFGVGVIFGFLLGGILVFVYGIQCLVILVVLVIFLGVIFSFICVFVSIKGIKIDFQILLLGGFWVSVFDLKVIVFLLWLLDVLRIFLVKVVFNFFIGFFMVMFFIIFMDFFQLEVV